MITKDNLKEILESLNFLEQDEIYIKRIGKYTLSIDFKNKILFTQKKLRFMIKPLLIFHTLKIL